MSGSSSARGDANADEHRRHALLDNLRPARWVNPAPEGRYDLVVIGAGPGGISAARAAVARGARTALIERNLIGGESLNVGCVPSKALIRTARFYAEMRDARSYGGIPPEGVAADFAAAMERMRALRVRLSRGVSARRLADTGIDVFLGAAAFVAPDAIRVDGRTLRFRRSVIATGARPFVPEVPGLAEAGYLTNENVFDLKQRPQRLLVIGGGPLGCEMAQAFCRLGVKVCIAQDEPKFLPREERDAAQLLSESMARDGVQINLNAAVAAVHTEGSEIIADLISDGVKSSVRVDAILAGMGRTPNVENLGLEVAEVRHGHPRGIAVDDFLCTSNPRIYAAGDVCLEHKFTHAAVESAKLAVKNALFRGRARLSALKIPWCTYTDPEIAHVGLYVHDAWEQGIPIETFTILMHDVDRAVTDGEDGGFVKIHVRQGTDRILGATVVARHAGEMINGVSLALNSGLGLRSLARVVHAYPTQADAFKMAADAYVRSRIQPRLPKLAERDSPLRS